MNIDVHPLQQKLIDTLKANKSIVSTRVEEAFLKMPRHLFLQHLQPEQVYTDKSIPTKYAESGEVISSASQPTVMAEILERFEVLPGQNVLEIGAGTGYNAALLAHLVGLTGRVVSLDIDEDIVRGARHNLQKVRTPNVQVECADGHYGFEAFAPYDRIVLSTSSLDVFPAWTDQLKEGGRLGLALRFYEGEGTFVIFEKHSSFLQSRGGAGAVFMPMRGGLGSETTPSDELGENALREWIKRGKMFSRILVYPRDVVRPEGSQEIVVKRVHSTFVYQWD